MPAVLIVGAASEGATHIGFGLHTPRRTTKCTSRPVQKGRMVMALLEYGCGASGSLHQVHQNIVHRPQSRLAPSPSRQPKPTTALLCGSPHPPYCTGSSSHGTAPSAIAPPRGADQSPNQRPTAAAPQVCRGQRRSRHAKSAGTTARSHIPLRAAICLCIVNSSVP